MANTNENNGFLGSKFGNFKHRPKDDLWNRIHENVNTHTAKGPLADIFENYHFYPNKKVWKNIATELFPQRKKNIIYFSWSAAASILLLIGAYFIFQNTSPDKLITEKFNNNIIAKNNIPTEGNNLKTESSILAQEEPEIKTSANIPTQNTINDKLLVNAASNKTEDKINGVGLIDSLSGIQKESFFNKLNLITAILESSQPEFISMEKRAFLNLPFKQEAINGSVDLKGLLASNISPSLLKTDAEAMDASPNFNGINTSSDLNEISFSKFNRESQYENIDHNNPIGFGLIYNYQISKRISLSTGLSYTKLSSFASTTRTNWKSEYKTTKHYIGFPVSINLDFVQGRNFNLFFTSGVQYDYGLLDKNSTSNYINGILDKEYFSKDKFIGGQAGFNVGFGTNYHLTKNFDLYLQTGITHYFYLSHYNIWSDKNIWPGIQTGLRFHL